MTNIDDRRNLDENKKCLKADEIQEGTATERGKDTEECKHVRTTEESEGVEKRIIGEGDREDHDHEEYIHVAEKRRQDVIDQEDVKEARRPAPTPKIKLMCGNCHGGIVSRNTPIIAEITSIAKAERANFIIMTEAGIPHDTYPFLEGYEPVGIATACSGRISHAGVAIYKSKDFKETPKYVQTCDQIPGFQAVEAMYEGFAIIAFYRSPDNKDRQQPCNILKVKDYFRQRPEESYVILGDLNIPEAIWASDGNSQVPHTTVHHEMKQELVDEMLMDYREQLVDFPTRIDPETGKGTVLDVVITDEQMEALCEPTTSKPSKSDHEWITVSIRPPKRLEEKIMENQTTRKKVAYKAACEQIQREVQWKDHRATTIEEKVEELHKVMKKYIGIHTEELPSNLTKQKNAKREQIKLIKYINRIKTRRKNGLTTGEKQEIRHYEKELYKLNVEEMRRHDDTIHSHITENPNNLHNILHKSEPKSKIKALKNTKTGKLVEKKEEVAEMFATYINDQQNDKIPENIDWQEIPTNKKSLNNLKSTPELFDTAIKTINKSNCKDPYDISAADLVGLYPAIKDKLVQLAEQMFKEGLVPNNIKKVLVIPLPKPPKKPDKPENLRPINLTSNILKLIERVAIIQLRNFLDPQGKYLYDEDLRTSFFTENQDGFREDRGTLNGLLKLTQIIQRVIKKGHGGLIIALDFKKAFDTVPHDKLLEAIHQTGIRGKVGEWISSWLEECEFEVQIEDARSTSKKITSGVKQGSCLGPLSFIIFLNTLLEELNNVTGNHSYTTTYKDLSERVHIQCYADDISLIYQFPEKKNMNMKDRKHITEQIVNSYLKVCSTWSLKWGLTFNHIKCEYITLGGKFKDMDLDLFLYGDKKIQRANIIKILGLKIENQKADPLQKMEKEARRKMQRTYSQIRTMFKQPNFPMMKNAYYTLMTSRALYASECFNLDTTPVNKEGKVEETVRTDKGKIVRHEPSEVASTGKRIYKLMFGSQEMLRDIAKQKMKGKIKNRAGDLPLTPGQQMIYKDIIMIFKILDDNPGLKIDDFLEKPPENKGIITRSTSDTLVDFNNKLTDCNHANRSIFRRHHSLIKWITENKIDPYEFIHFPKGRRKKKIKEILDGLDTPDNKLRELIWNGQYKLQDGYYK